MNPSEDAKKGEEQNLDEKVKQQLESDMQDIQEIMERIPFQMRKQIILPKIKLLQDSTYKILEMNSPEDLENIEALKEKLQSIDQAEQKNRELQKGLGNFVVQHMQNQESYSPTNKDQ